MRYYHKNKDDKIVLWDKIRNEGYTRHYNSMVRVIRKLGLEQIDTRKGYQPKPYMRAKYPGQKVQIDVKFVPSYCVSNGKKYYQYTAIDECTRLVFREMYDEHSTYSSKVFLLKLIQAFPFPIREVQTDNGSEFTNALKAKHCSKSLFKNALEEYDILYHRIRVATPRHNGKTERSIEQTRNDFIKK